MPPASGPRGRVATGWTPRRTVVAITCSALFLYAASVPRCDSTPPPPEELGDDAAVGAKDDVSDSKGRVDNAAEKSVGVFGCRCQA